MAIIPMIILLLALIAVFALALWLQMFLSRKEGKWPGLVLPIISLVFSLIYPLNVIAPPDGVTAWFVFQMILGWFAANIPTVILLVIYFICREKLRRRRQIEMMNIQDLN